jgi:eukaryotic-like serine/threonine-protein kinase
VSAAAARGAGPAENAPARACPIDYSRGVQAQHAAGDSLIGGTLGGKYRVLQQIGRGGMGIVYEAEHVGLGKRVAVKLMQEKYTHDSEAIARFHREALAAGRIGNPHIIEIFDIGTAPDGRSYVVMELLNGLPLSKVIETSGALPPWRALQIMKQVLRAVGAAHAKGIIHRDLKPDNIFLISQSEDHEFVKLLDFGISKVVSVEEYATVTKLTTTGVVMGTPLYMAPEQALGNTVDRYADIYACGVIFYEMLAGRPPFEGPTYGVLVAKLLTVAPPPLDELRPGLPSALVRAVHRALEKEPQDRFESAEAFAAALPSSGSPSSLEFAGTLADDSLAGARPVPSRPGRFRNVAIAAIAFTLAAAATAVVLVVTDEGEPPAEQAAQAAQGAPAAPGPTPAAAPGTLDVQSTPSRATVLVSGRHVGTTPLEVSLAPGRHEVRIELAGHAAVTMSAEVRSSARTNVVVPLAPSAAAPQGTLQAPAEAPAPAAVKTVSRGTKAPAGPAKTVQATRPSAPAPATAEPQPRPTLSSPTQSPTTVAPVPVQAEEPKAKPAPVPGPGAKPNPYPLR